MIVLAIETSTPQTSVAFGNSDGVLASADISGIRPRREAVIPTIQELMQRSGLELEQVGGIAAGIGPGLFTSLRVGLESAKALAQVLKVPLVGLCSLDVLAYPVRHARRPIAAVIDARRGEVFFGIYRPAPGGVTLMGGHRVAPPENLAAELEALGEDVLAVGNGATRYHEELQSALGAALELAPYSLRHPSAATMIELALPRFEREEHDELFEVVPLYLRKSDAEIAWDRREAAGQA